MYFRKNDSNSGFSSGFDFSDCLLLRLQISAEKKP